MARLIVVLLVGILLGWALSRAVADTWIGFVYPDDPSLIRHVDVGEFKSLEHCRQSSSAVALALGAKPSSYECGLNCKAAPADGGPRLCERTER